MHDDMAGQVIGRVPLPAIEHFAGLGIDSMEDTGVELGDIDAALVRTEADAADERADLVVGHDQVIADRLPRKLSQVELADGAGIVVRDPGAEAILADDDTVWLAGHR